MPKCKSCGQVKGRGGIYAQGDPYGDMKWLGLPPDEPTTGFFCHDCADVYHEARVKADEVTDAEFEKRGLCGFLESWVGRCKKKKPCRSHRNKKCWKCGKPATADCSVASSFVCGMPYCVDHPHEDTHYG